MISLSQFNDLTKNAKVQWANARKEFNAVRDALYNIKMVSERTSEYSDIGTGDTARRRNDGDVAWKGTLKQGYTKNFTQAEIALQVDVTKQLRMFDKYDEIMKRMRMMGKNAERRMEMDLTSLLSYAWSTSYTNLDGETVTTTTPDGKALIDDGHTANGSSNTFSNEISTTHSPIDEDVLEALEEKGNNFIDEADGRAVPVTFDTIITGRHAPTVYTVQRLVNPVNNLQPFTTDNNRNIYDTKYTHLIVPFIDMNMQTEARDSNKYRYAFVAALKDRDVNGFLCEVSQDIKFEAPEQVFESSVWQYLTTALYDFGTIRAGFIAGTKGTSESV